MLVHTRQHSISNLTLFGPSKELYFKILDIHRKIVQETCFYFFSTRFVVDDLTKRTVNEIYETEASFKIVLLKKNERFTIKLKYFFFLKIVNRNVKKKINKKLQCEYSLASYTRQTEFDHLNWNRRTEVQRVSTLPWDTLHYRGVVQTRSIFKERDKI